MSKIVITTVYFNLAHICKILMYSNTLAHLHTQILMLDVTLSKWIMKRLKKIPVQYSTRSGIHIFLVNTRHSIT